MGFKTDTIAAISTAMTNSGIGIVRLSGEDAFSIIDKIYKGKSPKLLSKQKAIPFTLAISWTENRRLMKCWFF